MGNPLNEYDLFGTAVAAAQNEGIVGKRFLFPPFSVLDAKSGDWQERKRAWKALGIQSETGRTALAYTLNGAQGKKYDYLPQIDSGTSIFDPVLCELAYSWFCRGGGQIVDPFAGGSVRGIVASLLGFKYWGCDLREEQIKANKDQIAIAARDNAPVWVCGDSAAELAEAPEADLIFTCPPYGDLEQYSEDPRDLSAMDWTGFAKAYRDIAAKSLACLRNDRFAVIVVGEFRDPKTGFYRGLVPLTVNAFVEAGAGFYGDAVLLTPIGTACMRVSHQFESGRKLALVHQHVLVFCKGSWKSAAQSIKAQ